jgi:hypothetical protein
MIGQLQSPLVLAKIEPTSPNVAFGSFTSFEACGSDFCFSPMSRHSGAAYDPSAMGPQGDITSRKFTTALP